MRCAFRMKASSAVLFAWALLGAAASYGFNLEDVLQLVKGNGATIDRHRLLTDEDITFYLYKNSAAEPTVLTYANLEEINGSVPLVFVIHGWKDSANNTWVKEIVQAYLKKGSYNIVAVDWYKPANREYYVAAGYVDDVGYHVGELISVLFFLNDIKLEDVNIVGHSLGAQAAGFAGKTIQNLSYSLVGRITALDPAAPLFDDEALTANQRLGKSDARVVVVIHTDGGILGGYSPTGTIDFFPNGGTAAQPGCLMHDIYGTICSHFRSYQLFVESLENSNGFVSTKCDSYSNYKKGKCDGNKQITLGGKLTADDAGSYYLYTKSEYPFSIE